jgi:transcriptional antiterminator RfaH
MPLLSLETYLHPEDLLQRSASVAEDACWWVLHTRPRTEKALARRFVDLGSSFFLPLHERRWRNNGRWLTSYMPLFPSYVFLHGDSQRRLQAVQTNLVAQTLAVADQPRLQDDLERVLRLIRSGAPLTPEERLEPGNRVQIIKGPLAGLEGRVLRKGKQLRLLIEIQILQRGVSLEIESWMIQPLTRAAADAGATTLGQ